MTSKTLILIDGHALAYRCFFALERTRMQTTDNTPTWAVYGFLKSLFDLLKNVQPDAIAVSFDKGRDTFRLKEYPLYKANRQSMPDSLGIQLGLIIEGIKTLDIPIYQIAGFEADDVIGTITKKASELGHKTLILTGDQDSFQLISSEDSVSVLIPSKGELIEFDRNKVHEKLGVWPEQIADYKGLSGDSSDNIPGVKGVGEKTAVKLLEQFGSVEGVYEHIEEIQSKSVKQKLETDKEMAFKSKYLATICREVPIEFDFEHTHVTLPDVEKLSAFLRKMQFHSLLRQLPEILSHFNEGKPVENIEIKTEQPEEPHKKEPALVSAPAPQGQMQLNLGLTQFLKEESKKTFQVDTEIIDTEEKFKKFLQTLEKTAVFSFDTETTSLDVFSAKLVGMSFGCNPQITVKDNKIFVDKSLSGKTNNVYIPVGHNEGKQLNLDYVIEKLKPIFESPEKYKIIQNAKYEINVLKNYNIDLDGIVMDTMIASYVKNPTFKHGLKQQAFGHLGYEMTEIEELIGKGKTAITMDQVSIEKVADYACGDAKSTLELGGYYAEHFEPDQEKLFYEIEEPLVPALAEIERNGISIDTEYLKTLTDELQKNICQLEEKIFEHAGEKFNINSPKQVGEILFEKLKLPVKGVAKTQTGYSTNAKILESLAHTHPIVDLLLEQRHYAKLKSTYVDALPLLINSKTGRIHTSFNQTITTTGRLSSSNPNLQNIPIRSEIGNRIRAAFVPQEKENYVIFSADYSQIELRLLAHVTEDEILVSAFRNNEDIHAETASKVFGVPLKEVTKEMRRKAKAVNFGIIYGQTSYGLSESLGIKPSEAKDIITKYFETYPKIKQYMDETIQQAHSLGYVETLYGRKRWLRDDLHSRIKTIREFAERAAINAPLQGTAADLIKIAMIKLYEKLKNSNYKSKIILQVHDELVLEVHKDELNKITSLVKECMELGQPLRVPLVIDITYGPTWMEAKD
ncbi:MAG: DNA polymerase I [Candidatus Melainabacteria bacterium GWA2_34_9]|nr:MAG: DNA polymerase I [Candidatus Melainabacteria bacterium GWA2_34_9]